MFKFALMLVATSVSLSGCLSLSDKRDWDCGVQEGFGCQTIGDTADRIVGGSRTQTVVSKFHSKGTAKSPNSYTSHRRVYGPVSSVPTWRESDILKIHIMPFVDEVNSYHEASVIYTPVSGGGWSKE